MAAMTSAASTHTPATIQMAGCTDLGGAEPPMRSGSTGTPPVAASGPTTLATITVELSGPPRRFARSTSARTASCGGRLAENRADLRVLDAARQAVAAEQIDVARAQSDADLPDRSAPRSSDRANA